MNWKWIDRLEQYLSRYNPFSFQNIFGRFLDKGAIALLDVGCGRGKTTELLFRNREASIIGIDQFVRYLQEAKERRIYRVLIRGDVRYLPFKEKVFDVAICFDVLEHLAEGRLFSLARPGIMKTVQCMEIV